MLSSKLPPSAFKAGEMTSAMLAERRGTVRTPVIKSAKLLVGQGYSQAVYNCLVLDESNDGALVDLGMACSLPEDVILQLFGGVARKAKQRWSAGSKVGLEFVGEQLVSAEASQEMVEIAHSIRARCLLAGIAALRERNFFSHGGLRTAAEDAESAFYKLENILRDPLMSVQSEKE